MHTYIHAGERRKVVVERIVLRGRRNHRTVCRLRLFVTFFSSTRALFVPLFPDRRWLASSSTTRRIPRNRVTFTRKPRPREQCVEPSRERVAQWRRALTLRSKWSEVVLSHDSQTRRFLASFPSFRSPPTNCRPRSVPIVNYRHVRFGVKVRNVSGDEWDRPRVLFYRRRARGEDTHEEKRLSNDRDCEWLKLEVKTVRDRRRMTSS